MAQRFVWRVPSHLRSVGTGYSPIPESWHEWTRLCDLIPELDRMHVVRHFNQKPPPHPTSDAAFVAFAACFADTRKREVLRALIFDLLKEDLKEIIKGK